MEERSEWAKFINLSLLAIVTRAANDPSPKFLQLLQRRWKAPTRPSPGGKCLLTLSHFTFKTLNGHKPKVGRCEIILRDGALGIYDLCVRVPIPCLLTMFRRLFSLVVNIVLNVKALVGAFNQEKALVEAFSALVKTTRRI